MFTHDGRDAFKLTEHAGQELGHVGIPSRPLSPKFRYGNPRDELDFSPFKPLDDVLASDDPKITPGIRAEVKKIRARLALVFRRRPWARPQDIEDACQDQLVKVLERARGLRGGRVPHHRSLERDCRRQWHLGRDVRPPTLASIKTEIGKIRTPAVREGCLAALFDAHAAVEAGRVTAERAADGLEKQLPGVKREAREAQEAREAKCTQEDAA